MLSSDFNDACHVATVAVVNASLTNDNAESKFCVEFIVGSYNIMQGARLSTLYGYVNKVHCCKEFTCIDTPINEVAPDTVKVVSKARIAVCPCGMNGFEVAIRRKKRRKRKHKTLPI